MKADSFFFQVFLYTLFYFYCYFLKQASLALEAKMLFNIEINISSAFKSVCWKTWVAIDQNFAGIMTALCGQCFFSISVVYTIYKINELHKFYFFHVDSLVPTNTFTNSLFRVNNILKSKVKWQVERFLYLTLFLRENHRIIEWLK